ncbi:DNA circularization protein [Varunaivibrio sulfuroxidans]|uniref:Prophage DNA circulation protein n=1 Tax=Varunaivibrio sulfuroxidans TaxID=1773489 RepID=A0A4V2UNM1_9PROT|nr:DNA circularization N-terminal domain-containing protein [Varunaivibrio sulfuroxidans]TCS62591.1 prophage DNA circulation protein [Varunaivibrio sulfuroxidans]WES30740.1 DNA circularization N-terminal domain-containing protein [Varunaivibrio sulfuroxidans]
MSWRDNLRKASFRGASFFYSSADGELGRRFQVHEYPGQDRAYHEDLGAKTPRHRIEAYVWGAGALDRAARLRAAIAAPGSGALVHPVLGELTVACTEARERHTTRDGGYVAFSLTFEETGDVPRPRARAATGARIDHAAGGAMGAAQSDFKNTFNVGGLPQFVAADGADKVRAGIDALTRAFSGVRLGGADAAAFASGAGAARDQAASLVRDPAGLAQKLGGLIALPLDLPGGRLAGALGRLYDYAGPASAPTAAAPPTATRRAQQGNADALSALIRRTAVIHGARAAARETFANRAAALTRRDTLAQALEGESLTAPDPTYRALTALRAEVVQGLDARAAGLPRLRAVTPIATRPALALAHDIYGDTPAAAVGMADALVRRNRVRHPGFVPGGDTLEVTVDA